MGTGSYRRFICSLGAGIVCLFFISKESTPFCSARRFAEVSFETKNAAYAAGMRTARKRNMVAGATALRRECAPRRTLFMTAACVTAAKERDSAEQRAKGKKYFLVDNL